MASASHILQTSVPNVCFSASAKRGLRSIREFQAGLAIQVNLASTQEKDYFATTRVSLDLPTLRLYGLTDPNLIKQLLTACGVDLNRPAPPVCNVMVGGRVHQIPPDETMTACGVCQHALWILSMKKATMDPTSVICVNCGHTVRFLRAFHSIGHA